MKKRLLILGGGTAGWITAAYLARLLGAKSADGVEITLVEADDIGIIGVGEGTFPTIRKTLKRIGIDEATLIRECDATFKQGIKFTNWRCAPDNDSAGHYFHAFQPAAGRDGLDLLPYWLLGVAGDGLNWDQVNSPQKRVADAHRAPKLITHGDFTAPFNYAYHLDAVKLARFLRKVAVDLGVRHLVDTVIDVNLDGAGAIKSISTRASGKMDADLYIDCSGFSAKLIGEAMRVPFRSCRSTLFCDSAVVVQVPYDASSPEIPSYTISTAQEAGWTWDIGLEQRRGVGYVFSSAHTTTSRAHEVLAKYLGMPRESVAPREMHFQCGYRETSWQKNCVAIGLASGFFEPLESTGIILIEVAAVMLATLFPWGGEMEPAARQFNALMLKRFERARDFIKMHYSLTERRDSDFWRDNVNVSSLPDSLSELLERWRFRPPGPIDIDMNVDLFTEVSWQYVLYGMGYKTDLSNKSGVLRYHADAKVAFAKIQQEADFAIQTLPTNRNLLAQARDRRFGAAVG